MPLDQAAARARASERTSPSGSARGASFDRRASAVAAPCVLDPAPAPVPSEDTAVDARASSPRPVQAITPKATAATTPTTTT